MIEIPLTKSRLNEIKELRLHARQRRTHQMFIVEGVKIITEILHKEAFIKYIAYDIHKAKMDDDAHAILEQAHTKNIPCYGAPPTTFERISSVNSPQGILAALAVPAWDFKNIISKEPSKICIGDHIQDPTNIGLMVRNAIAFNLDALVLTDDSADAYGPKAVRTSAGAILDLAIFYASRDQIIELKNSGYIFYGAIAGAGQDMSTVRPSTSKTALVFGNEGHGLSSQMELALTTSYRIPISHRIDSLNISAAVAITLYHFFGRDIV